MNRLPLLAVVLLAACSSPRGQHFTAPSSAAVHSSINKVGTEVNSAKVHADKAKAAVATAVKLAPEVPELRDALKSAGSEIDLLTQQLINAQNEVVTLEKNKIEEDGKVQAQTDTLNKYSDANAKLSQQLAAVLKKYHFLKLLASIIAAALGIFIALQFPIPPPYNIYALGGAGVGAAALVWIFL
jgi:TolA-binding protein